MSVKYVAAADIQTMSHIVDSCPLTEFDGGLQRLHTADKAAVDWLTSCGTFTPSRILYDNCKCCFIYVCTDTGVKWLVSP